jgi:Ca2+-binding RTX toxin-like protein
MATISYSFTFGFTSEVLLSVDQAESAPKVAAGRPNLFGEDFGDHRVVAVTVEISGSEIEAAPFSHDGLSLGYGGASYNASPQGGSQYSADVAVGGATFGNVYLIAFHDTVTDDIKFRIAGPGGPGVTIHDGPSGDFDGFPSLAASDIEPAVAALSFSSFVIVGQAHYDAGESDIVAKIVGVSLFDTVTTIADNIEVSPLIENTYDERPAVAAGNGHFFVTWNRKAGNVDSDIYINRISSDGATQTGAIQVNDTLDTSETVAGRTSVAVSASTGNVFVAWQSNGYSGLTDLDIAGRILDSSGNPLTGAFRVNTGSAGEQTTPNVISLTNGMFVVAWASEISGTSRIVARLFSATGAALTGEVVIAEPGEGELPGMVTPDLAALASGKLLAVWKQLYTAAPSDAEMRELEVVRSITGDDLPGGELLGVDDSLADLVNARGGADWVRGYAGRDTLNGGSGDDLLDGGTGNDTLNGGKGNDALLGGSEEVADRNDENETPRYDDEAYGNEGNDTFRYRAGDDFFDGGAGRDTLDFVDFINEGVTYFLATQDVAAVMPTGTLRSASVENMRGTSFGDRLSGDGADNFIDGSYGNDTLNGLAGVDTMVGGPGDDIMTVDRSGDQTIEDLNGGIDTVYSSVSRTLGANLENLFLTGAANLKGAGNALNNLIIGNEGANEVKGLAGNDTLTGLGGNDRLDGGTGDDSMTGGTGSDRYYVDSAGDIVSEGLADPALGGIDTVYSKIDYTLGANVENLRLQSGVGLSGAGNALNNRIYGGNGADFLQGLGGHDRLEGGNGADTLAGGTGNDTLTGGANADVFRFANVNAGNDRIEDFVRNGDRFQLSGGSFTSLQIAGADTILTHNGGTIRIVGVSNLTLAQWNALVLPGGEAFAGPPPGAAWHEGAALLAQVRHDTVHLPNGDWVFA